MAQAYEALIAEDKQRRDYTTDYRTGFMDLDKYVSLGPGDLFVIGGKTSMGKTTFAMNIAENAAIKHGKSVAVFSMEMASL